MNVEDASIMSPPCPEYTDESCFGIQRSGSYTCITPTAELMPLQTSSTTSARISRCRLNTYADAQNTGHRIAKYTPICATPARGPV
jgi:hypothetical protein